jgi:thiol-disulfide isomerase/thioredoxin|tara:strand:+ start:391 stop:831 length:441 start_codon:yes stop_codon:yes gene_type:complete
MNIILDSKDCPSSPYPEPYSGAMVAQEELEEFIEKTLGQNKQPIIIFGANWCPDARLLEGVMRLPTVKSFLERNANILNIDVGNYEINTALFKMFDKNIQDGIPRVFIMNKMGQNINLHVNETMRKARELSIQDIFNYFQEFVIET